MHDLFAWLGIRQLLSAGAVIIKQSKIRIIKPIRLQVKLFCTKILTTSSFWMMSSGKYSVSQIVSTFVLFLNPASYLRRLIHMSYHRILRHQTSYFSPAHLYNSGIQPSSIFGIIGSLLLCCPYVKIKWLMGITMVSLFLWFYHFDCFLYQTNSKYSHARASTQLLQYRYWQRLILRIHTCMVLEGSCWISLPATFWGCTRGLPYLQGCSRYCGVSGELISPLVISL